MSRINIEVTVGAVEKWRIGRLISIPRDAARVNAGTATFVLPFLHGPPHAVNGPVLACFDHAPRDPSV
jgi:hypothetical protein